MTNGCGQRSRPQCTPTALLDIEPLRRHSSSPERPRVDSPPPSDPPFKKVTIEYDLDCGSEVEVFDHLPPKMRPPQSIAREKRTLHVPAPIEGASQVNKKQKKLFSNQNDKSDAFISVPNTPVTHSKAKKKNGSDNQQLAERNQRLGKSKGENGPSTSGSVSSLRTMLTIKKQNDKWLKSLI